MVDKTKKCPKCSELIPEDSEEHFKCGWKEQEQKIIAVPRAVSEADMLNILHDQLNMIQQQLLNIEKKLK